MAYVNHKGARLYYDTIGKGSPVVLLTGTGYAATTWPTEFVDGLARNHMVLRLDYRGIGKSTTDADGVYTTASLGRDAAEVLRASGVSRAHVFAHSMGGMVAQEMYFHAPELVGSFIFAASGAGGAAPLDVALAGVPPVVIEEIEAKGFDTYVRDKHREFLTPAFVTAFPDRVQWLDEAFLAGCSDLEIYYRHVAARTAHGAVDRLPQIRVPALVVVGTEDLGGLGQTRVEMSHILASRIPNARLELLPGANHGLVWERHREMLEMTERFIAGLDVQFGSESGAVSV